MKRAVRILSLLLAALAFGSPGMLSAATYLPLPDAELADRAPVIVRARVVDRSVALELLDGVEHPFTVTTLSTLETLKGAAPEVFQVRLPGGAVGDIAWWIPGTPVFSPDTEVILFLTAREKNVVPIYGLTEFGLSKFDVVEDRTGRAFAVRSAFSPKDDDILSGRVAVTVSTGADGSSGLEAARDLSSFLCALRATGNGAAPEAVAYGKPQGALRAAGGVRPLWVNIGGPEPGNCGQPCLFRWFWDTGNSPNGVVTISGTQTNLSDGGNGTSHVQNAVDKWHAVPGSDVRYSGVSGTGTVQVVLDAPASFDGGKAFSTPLGCGGGVLGLGGTAKASGVLSYKGESSYFAFQTGIVTMRKVTCNTGYPANVFRTALLHEVGHTLGLGHPDQGTSTHSTTTPADWNNAVMHSFIQAPYADSPQTDDIQAIQYYYPGSGGACVPNATTFCAGAGGRFQVQVRWTKSDGTSGDGQAVTLTSDTGYFWFFSSNNVEMVIKVVDGRSFNSRFWAFAGGLTNVNVVITVTDTATGAVKTYVNPQGTAFQPIQDTNAFPGASTPDESVNAPAGEAAAPASPASDSAACTADATTLCLNNQRFKVQVRWTKPDATNGAGQAVGLTGDTGYFWFFSSNNVEMVIKLVDGRTFNNRFWAFAGGLTNVNVVITVTDAVTGGVKTYTNPQGTAFQPVQDTNAFPGP